jgi:predicted porin
MVGQNFEREVALDEPRFNRALWKGLKGALYPTVRHGRNLSTGRNPLWNGKVASLK